MTGQPHRSGYCSSFLSHTEVCHQSEGVPGVEKSCHCIFVCQTMIRNSKRSCLWNAMLCLPARTENLLRLPSAVDNYIVWVTAMEQYLCQLLGLPKENQEYFKDCIKVTRDTSIQNWNLEVSDLCCRERNKHVSSQEILTRQSKFLSQVISKKKIDDLARMRRVEKSTWSRTSTDLHLKKSSEERERKQPAVLGPVSTQFRWSRE